MLRKDLFMRKTNKKLSKLVDDKSGVILVTVIFIVAMALVFITTALTISIANRQRVYSNATSDQARLTVTSLSQALWQAIYSQQISDDMLYDLAKGSTNSGTLITYTSTDIPGMGNGGAVATAYFYLIQEEDRTASPMIPRKIGIECKCEIDGVAQYYTMVLQKNQGETTPSPSFDIQCDFGEGGTIDSCVIGFNTQYFNSATANYGNLEYYDAADNIIFMHNPTMNGEDNFGFYSTLITDGVIQFRDSVFTRDVYFLGANAGFNWLVNQNITPSNRHDGTRQFGNFYFWGTTNPFYYNGNPQSGSQPWTVRGIENIYFDRRDQKVQVADASGRNPGDPGYVPTYSHSITGFEGFATYHPTFTNQNFQDMPSTGTIHYEHGITGYTNSSSRTFVEEGASAYNSSGAVVNESALWDPVTANDIDDYLEADPEKLDTIAEVNRDYTDALLADAVTLTQADFNGTIQRASTGSGAYVITSEINYEGSSNVTFNVTSGDIVIFVKGCNLNLKKICTITGTGDSSVIFVLLSNGGSQGKVNIYDNAGIVDTRCMSGSYYDIHNIDQTKTPRCYIYSGYTGGKPLNFEGNQNRVLTAFIGFFSSGSATGDGNFVPTFGAGQQGYISINNCMSNTVYYGRIAAGGIDTRNTGNFLYIPYCPTTPSSLNDRGYAYRDATDYSVVSDECGYFTGTV